MSSFLSQFRRLPPRLHFKILDYIDDPRTISIICNAFPALMADNQYWSLRYIKPNGHMTTNLPTQPGAMYHAYIIPRIIKSDVDSRRIRLSNALHKVGLYLRSDSKLCRHWVDGLCGVTESNWSLDKVVAKCIEMRWLFDYCNFRIMLKRYLNKHDLEYNDETFGLAAQETLAEKPVPKKLPWLNDVALRREYDISEPVYDYYTDSEYGFDSGHDDEYDDYFDAIHAAQQTSGGSIAFGTTANVTVHPTMGSIVLGTTANVPGATPGVTIVEYDPDPDYVYEPWY